MSVKVNIPNPMEVGDHSLMGAPATKDRRISNVVTSRSGPKSHGVVTVVAGSKPVAPSLFTRFLNRIRNEAVDAGNSATSGTWTDDGNAAVARGLAVALSIADEEFGEVPDP